MTHRIVKPFPYSTDGVTAELLATDAEREIRPELVAGLEREGFIRAVSGKKMCPACVRNADDSITCFGFTDPHCGQYKPDALLGSDVLPALIKLGEKDVQLADLVASAHTASELSVADWNALEQDERSTRIWAEVVKRCAEAGAPLPTLPSSIIEIPDGWRDLKGPELMALAAKLTADPVKSKADATRVIEAELARRASETR